MKWIKPVAVGGTVLLSLILTAYLCGTFLGNKPFSWENEPRLSKGEIYEAMQGQWRTTFISVGNEVRNLQESASSVRIDKSAFHHLNDKGMSMPHFINTISVDATQDPAWIDMADKATRENLLGIIEINQDKNRLRLLMRFSTSPLGRPANFQAKERDDIYWEFTR